MKRLYIYCSLFGLILGMMSCNDDKETITVTGFQDGASSELTASQTSIELNAETAGVAALTLSWGSYNLGISDENYHLPDEMVNNYIELSTDASFNNIESTLIQGNSRSYTHVELNNLTKKIGFEPWKASPLYIRIKYVLGNNLAPQYSNALTVNIIPYGIRMNSMEMLGADQETVTGYLYSPAEDGVYQGFIGASGWMNAYFKENDGTMWGNDGVVGTAFLLSNDATTFWNIWYPGVAGSYLTTVNTVTKQWSATLLSELTITVDGNPISMKFSVPQNTWSGSFAASGACTITSATATTKAYTLETSTDDDAAISGTLNLDFYASIPKAGNYILKLAMGSEEIEATLEEGEIEPSSYFNYLEMINPDNWNDVKCRLYSPEEDYIYRGFYYAWGWENFKFATEDRETVYGSVPESLYELDPTGAAWNIWMDTENSAFYLFTANLSDNTWGCEEITKVSVSGDFNGWALDTDMMEYDVDAKIWRATLDINFIEWGMNIILNDNWDMKLTKKNDGVMQYGAGNNIVPSEMGVYLFTLNMYDMGNIIYTLEKQ